PQRAASRPTRAAIGAKVRACGGLTRLASATPGDAAQEAEAARKAARRDRTLDDGVLQRLLDRGCGVLRRSHHGAAAFGEISDGVFCSGAGLLVAVARPLLGNVREGVERVGDLAGQRGDVVLHG